MKPKEIIALLLLFPFLPFLYLYLKALLIISDLRETV